MLSYDYTNSMELDNDLDFSVLLVEGAESGMDNFPFCGVSNVTVMKVTVGKNHVL